MQLNGSGRCRYILRLPAAPAESLAGGVSVAFTALPAAVTVTVMTLGVDAPKWLLN